MMKKVWLVLLAVVLVSGLAMLGCSHSGSKDKDGDGDGDDVTVTPVVLGEGDEVFTVVNNANQKGWATNGVDDKEYPLSIEDLIAAKYLVLELSKKPEGGLQVYWQGDGNSNWSWTQTDDVIGSTGVPNAIKGATLSDANVLKIELSKAFKNYGKLRDCTKVKFFIGYYTQTVDDLGVKKAYLEIVSGGAATPAPTVTSVTVDPATAEVNKGTRKTFKAIVVGENNPDDTVTWTISGTGLTEKTTISATGSLSVAEDEAATTITVKATSTVDTTKFGTATVTVIEALPPPPPTPASFFALGDFDDEEKSWYTNGVDGAENDFTVEILASAKYFIAKMHTDELNGVGGLSFAHQGSDDWTDWRQDDVCDWTSLHTDFGFGEYGIELDFYIVIDLSTITDWDKTVNSDGAKLILSWPFGWTSDDPNYSFVAGYLSLGTLTKPAVSVDVEKDDIYGWIALEVPEMDEE